MQVPDSIWFSGRGVIEDADFKVLLRRLLGVCVPSLGEQWQAACSPEHLLRYDPPGPALAGLRDRKAAQVFSAFLTEDIALRLLGPSGHELFGPLEDWAWALPYLRDCMAFGWLCQVKYGRDAMTVLPDEQVPVALATSRYFVPLQLWVRCGIRFGGNVARSESLGDLLRSLLVYFREVRRGVSGLPAGTLATVAGCARN